MHLCRFFLSITLCASAFCADEFAEIQQKIVSFKLDNGLTVILYRRGEAPVISCVTYVKIGSVDEVTGITGIAHQLEHLAFKGTPHIGTKDFAAEQPALAKIDAIYKEIQRYEQKLPAAARDSFLTLLAQATSTGGKLETQLDERIAAWQQAGFQLADADKAALAGLVRAYAEQVAAAEKFVEQNALSNVIDRNGGSGLNAYTTDDSTVYHVELPSNKLELWAALESDRFMNLVPRQLEKEKQVVLEERRMRIDSNAAGKLYEAFLATAFTAHPYGITTIGARSDILGYTREKVMRFYRAHYVPSLVCVAVVGDIDLDATRKILTDYFGQIPPAPEPEPLATIEPPQEGERRVTIEFPAQPLLLVGYHVPEYAHPDTPALIVLNEIAATGRTSRLYADLVKTKKANSAAAGLDPGERYPRLFVFQAEPPQGGGTAELETELLGEIEKLKTEPPTAEEMQRVLTDYRANILRSLSGSMGLAQELCHAQMIAGDWHDLFREIQRMSAVTPAEVTAVAQKYFTRQNRTVGWVVNTAPPAQRARGTDPR